jgi:hypothetical protein
MKFWNAAKIGAAVVVVTAVGGVIYWLVKVNNPPITTSSLLEAQGYIEVVPPSNFYGPGTINTIETLSGGKFSLHPTCNIDPSLISKTTIESRTIDYSLNQALSKHFDISAKIKNLLSSASQAQAKNIDISFRNVSILMMSDESLWNLRRQLITNECQEAIALNIQHGGIVCQTEAVIKADVVYDISYNEKLNVEDLAKLTKEIAQKLQLEADSHGGNSITGKGLFYGIRLDQNGIILNTSPEASATDCRIRA